MLRLLEDHMGLHCRLALVFFLFFLISLGEACSCGDDDDDSGGNPADDDVGDDDTGDDDTEDDDTNDDDDVDDDDNSANDPDHCGRQDVRCEDPRTCEDGACSSDCLRFSFVPPLGSNDNLEGVAGDCGDPADLGIAVYIRVAANWWTKPTFADPLANLNANGTWQCDVTTGGADTEATAIAGFLWPRSLGNPPEANNATVLPAELFEQSLDHVIVTRRGRAITFSGLEWSVKRALLAKEGPGPNFFTDAEEALWVDADERLHLTLHQEGSEWFCTEVITHVTGRGEYQFFLDSRSDLLDPNAVLGLFTWDFFTEQPGHREIDIEFSRWTDPDADNAQFVVQPYANPGNMHRFNVDLSTGGSVHVFRWLVDRIEFLSARGTEYPPAPEDILQEWSYTGVDIPEDGEIEARINLWLVDGIGPLNGEDIEITLTRFEYEPEGN
jgi:hypothetical protein